MSDLLIFQAVYANGVFVCLVIHFSSQEKNMITIVTLVPFGIYRHVLKKPNIRKRAQDLHTLEIDKEIIPFMNDYYAGKFKSKTALLNSL